jgi:hypothetical protein
MTGTGYASENYGQWGAMPVMVFLVLTLIGGCAGSTACGMKIFRVQVALKTVTQHVRRLAYPHGVFRDALQWTPGGWLGCLGCDELHLPLFPADRCVGGRADGYGP